MGIAACACYADPACWCRHGCWGESAGPLSVGPLLAACQSERVTLARLSAFHAGLGERPAHPKRAAAALADLHRQGGFQRMAGQYTFGAFTGKVHGLGVPEELATGRVALSAALSRDRRHLLAFRPIGA